MQDDYTERLLQGYRKQRGISRYLSQLEAEGYWIGFARLRFTVSQAIYPLFSTNATQKEKAWSKARDLFDSYIQQWITNAFRGNTRTRKRSKDPGWVLIGFFHRGANGYLHVHVFLCVNAGPNSALRCNSDQLAERLTHNKYHPQINDVYIEQCRPKKDNAIRYASKDAWRPGSGEDLVFARACEPNFQ